MKSAIITTKLKQATEAYEAGNYATAHPLFEQAAQQKSTIAQYYLGKMYAEGLGVEQNHVQAAHYFRQAAERGYPPAQAKLGEHYANGWGLPVDYRQAAEWFNRAADEQDKTPEFRLQEACKAFDSGDYDFALSAFQELAQDENEIAQFHMGELYANGKGVEVDLLQAADWYRLAAEQEHIDAQVRLGRMYAEGRGVEQDYRIAADWLAKAADQEENDTEKLFNQAQTAYRQHDYATALPVMEKLAKQGFDAAQYQLGSMYTHGYGVTQDDNAAAEWYFKAAEQGYPAALTMLREQVNKSSTPAALYYLGEVYSRACGVEQDSIQAADYYLRAAQRGYLPAQIKMGEIYAAGRGVAQDFLQASAWYGKAARASNEVEHTFSVEDEASKSDATTTSRPVSAPTVTFAASSSVTPTVVRPSTSLASNPMLYAPNQKPTVVENTVSEIAPEADSTEEDDANAAYRVSVDELPATETASETRDDLLNGEEPEVINAAELLQQAQEVEASAEEETVPVNSSEEMAEMLIQAAQAFENEEFEQAFTLFKSLAEQGHAEAQYHLGTMYGKGLGVACDERQAAVWYLKSADQGYAPAQYNLGVSYAKGSGIMQNLPEASYWYTQAAKQGHAAAQNNLAELFTNGLGVAQDYAQAFEWFEKAAEQDDAIAQYNLGLAYAQGRGVAQDDAKAMEYFVKSAEQGNAIAQYNLGVRYESGQGVKQDYREAAHWYQKAAEQGNASAQNNLGLMYADGHGVPKDADKAADWCEKAADQGHADAQFNLGLLYAQSTDSEEGQRQAAAWYLKAAEQGHSGAQNNLAIAYFNGWGVEQDHDKAIIWYRAAAEQGVVAAQYGLGWLYFHSSPPNFELAEQWWKEAVQQGDQNAQRGLDELAKRRGNA